MKIFLLGSSGLLGTRLQRHLQKNNNFKTLCFTRSQKYPCKTNNEIFTALNKFISEFKPDVIINLVAMTNVDSCEHNMIASSLINSEFNHILSDICRTNANGRPFIIYISSDQVYSGVGPHKESEANPINIYGLTKLQGEYPILRDNGCVLRTNFFGESSINNRSSLSDWLILNSRKNLPIYVFNDVLFSPIGMDTLCQSIIFCAEEQLSGLYNLGSKSMGVSKAEFANKLYDFLKLNNKLLINSSVIDSKLFAKRPIDMRMDSTHFSNTTGIYIPTIEEEIEREYSELLQ